jgi:hypothetical protein
VSRARWKAFDEVLRLIEPLLNPLAADAQPLFPRNSGDFTPLSRTPLYVAAFALK